MTDDDSDILEDERVDKELRRWQDAIRDKIISMGVPDSKIDGAGCDSGDPLDFTLAEVGQGINHFIDQLDELRAPSVREAAAKEIAAWIFKLEHPLTSETDLYTTQGIVQRIIERHCSPVSAAAPVFKNTKEAMEYAARHNVPSVIPVSAAGGDEDGWLPIATVPRDGTEIILAHGNSQWMDEWITDPKHEVREGEGGFWMMCDQWTEPETPSHWRPLSPLPGCAADSVGEEGK